MVSLYAPNGRVVGSPFYEAKLVWFERLARWLEASANPDEPLVLGGDFNVAPTDADVWDPRACHGGTHVSPREREAFARARPLGARRRCTARTTPSPVATPGGTTAPATSTRTSACASTTCSATRPLAERAVWAEIDREARKGKPIPSDHAPLVVDLDEPGHPFDAGWAPAEGRIAARRGEPV